MKKAFSLVLVLALLFAFSAAAEISPVVYVTIVNGDLKLVQHPVSLYDTDGDGVLTVSDALYIAHEDCYEGGAQAGYAAQMGDYGLMLTRLWGVENGGAFGFYVNNVMSMGLADPIAEGDYVSAYVYTDTTGRSDTFTYFDTYTAEPGEITLTLSASGFDPVTYAPVSTPVSGAEIVINGSNTGVFTDANGEAVLSVQAGDVVSAVSASQNIVAPCCCIIIDATGL